MTPNAHFADLVALTQEGLDATKVCLKRLQAHPGSSEVGRSLALANTHIETGELWLARALEQSAVTTAEE